MQKKSIWLQGRVRFHARAASSVANAAQKFESVVILNIDNQLVDAKRPLAVMRFGAQNDCWVEVTSNGSDEIDAIQAMEAVITSIACGENKANI